MRKTKAVCICQGGNCRSVACAYVLKYFFECDALSCSAEQQTPETIRMLCDWSDYVIVMQPEFRSVVPVEFTEKIRVVDVGADRWFNGLHPELVEVCRAAITSMAG